jgi:hypothetical protein
MIPTLKFPPDPESSDRRAPPVYEPRLRDKVLPFPPDPHQERPADPASRGSSRRAFSDALDLVEQAAHRMREIEERSDSLEAEIEALSRRAAEDLRGAEARARGAEALAELAEKRAREAAERADEANARADEAEGWLMRLHELLSRNFEID